MGRMSGNLQQSHRHRPASSEPGNRGFIKLFSPDRVKARAQRLRQPMAKVPKRAVPATVFRYGPESIGVLVKAEDRSPSATPA